MKGDNVQTLFDINDKRPQTLIIKEQYDNIHFLYGSYNPTHFCLGARIAIFGTLCGLFPLIYFLIKELLKDTINWWLCICFGAFAFVWCIGYVIFLNMLYGKSSRVYYYKDKNNTITIYKYYFRKKLAIAYGETCFEYNYKNKSWQNSIDKHMGANLMFPFISFPTKLKNTLFSTIIKVYHQFESLKIADFRLSRFKNNKLKSMNRYSLTSMPVRRSSAFERLKVKEINTNRNVEVPKSFIDFCKAKGIEPPKENEHLHYV